MNLKTIGLIALLVALLFIAATVLAGVETQRLKMNLNEPCIEYVEEVTAEIDGVIEIVWDDETEELEVVYEAKKTNIREIERAISEAGFSTPNFAASESAVENLPAQCKTKIQSSVNREFTK